MRRATVVYNPTAGRFPSWLLTERAAGVLRSQGWQIQIETTQSGEHVTELARQAAAAGMDAFFVTGGDGSLNWALPGLLGSQTALGVLPAGTANVWAQELGLPGLSWTRLMALEESARLLAPGIVRSVDVGLCNGRPFLLWAGVGLDAFIVHRIEPRQPWVKHFAVAHYTASVIINATAWRGMDLRLWTDGQEISGRFLLAVLSNIHLYAGGWSQLSPNARLDDGVMDLWLFRGETLADTVQVAWNLLSGNHLQSDQVEFRSFRRLEIESDAPMFLQVDGEPVESAHRCAIEVSRQALKVLVPPETPRPLFSEDEYPAQLT